MSLRSFSSLAFSWCSCVLGQSMSTAPSSHCQRSLMVKRLQGRCLGSFMHRGLWSGRCLISSTGSWTIRSSCLDPQSKALVWPPKTSSKAVARWRRHQSARAGYCPKHAHIDDRWQSESEQKVDVSERLKKQRVSDAALTRRLDWLPVVASTRLAPE